MKAHTHNELKLKRKMSEDYRPDENCTFQRPDGRVVVLPVFVIQAIRSGELKVV